MQKYAHFRRRKIKIAYVYNIKIRILKYKDKNVQIHMLSSLIKAYYNL